MFSTMRSVKAEMVKKGLTSSADRIIQPSPRLRRAKERVCSLSLRLGATPRWSRSVWLLWLFLALRLFLGRRAISASLHLRMALGAHFLLLILPAHLLLMILPTHLLLLMLHLLIHRMLPASSTSGAARLACLHFRLVLAHFSPVPLISGLRLVSVCSSFFSVTGSRASALPIMFSHISVVVFSVSRSGSLKVTVSYVSRFVSSFSSSRCCSLALTLG